MSIVSSNARAIAIAAMPLATLLALIGFVAMDAVLYLDKRQQVRGLETNLAALQQRLGLPKQEGSSGAANVDPFLLGRTVSLASNSLQQRLTKLVDSVGGTLISINIRANAERDINPPQAVLEAGVEVNVVELQEILYQLESQLPLVFVEGMTVQRQSSLQLDAATDENPRLKVELHIVGYARPTER